MTSIKNLTHKLDTWWHSSILFSATMDLRKLEKKYKLSEIKSSNDSTYCDITYEEFICKEDNIFQHNEPAFWYTTNDSNNYIRCGCSENMKQKYENFDMLPDEKYVNVVVMAYGKYQWGAHQRI